MEQQLHRGRDLMEVYRNRYGGCVVNDNTDLLDEIDDENMSPAMYNASTNNVANIAQVVNNIENALDRLFL